MEHITREGFPSHFHFLTLLYEKKKFEEKMFYFPRQIPLTKALINLKTYIIYKIITFFYI